MLDSAARGRGASNLKILSRDWFGQDVVLYVAAVRCVAEGVSIV